MIIQINSDYNISGNERLSAYLEKIISESLNRFDNQITRIEVYLADENGAKTGEDDKRCVLEARLEGMKPFAVTNHGNTIENAVKGAIDKLKSSLDTTLGRLKNY